MGASSWRARADAPPNKGRKYPPEVLTAGEVAAVIAAVLTEGPDRDPQPGPADAAVPVRAARLRGRSRCGLPTST